MSHMFLIYAYVVMTDRIFAKDFKPRNIRDTLICILSFKSDLGN